MKILHLTAGCATLMFAMPATAQMISAKDPQTLVRALQAKGFQAKLETAGGEPAIVSGAGGFKFSIFFENCTNGRACTTVSFFTGFTDLDATLEQVNEWNRTKRFIRAYVDREGDPVMRMDVDLDHAGIATANFGEYLDIWTSLVPEFVGFLRKR